MTDPGWCRLRRGLVGAALMTALTTGGTFAQDAGSNKHLTLVGIPSGTVAPHGTIFGSLAVTNRRSAWSRTADGSMVLGLGLGSAEDGIGFQFTVDNTSLTNKFGDSGSFGIKASRRLSSGDWPVYASLGVDYLAPWGTVRRRNPGTTLAVTTFGQIRGATDTYPIMMTLGVGNRVRANNTRAGVFAGVGVGLTQNLAASLAWTGEAVDLGLGLQFAELRGMSFTVSASDVTNRVNSRRLVATATWSLQDVFGR